MCTTFLSAGKNWEASTPPCEELSLKSSILKSHLLSSEHYKGKRLDRKEASEHAEAFVKAT